MGMVIKQFFLPKNNTFSIEKYVISSPLFISIIIFNYRHHILWIRRAKTEGRRYDNAESSKKPIYVNVMRWWKISSAQKEPHEIMMINISGDSHSFVFACAYVHSCVHIQQLFPRSHFSRWTIDDEKYDKH